MSKSLKRILSMALTGAMVVSMAGMVVTAHADDQVELNALFMKQAGYSEDDVNAMTEEFMAANPGVKVNTTFVAYEELEPKILSAAASGSYDVVLGDCIWPAQFAKAGLVLDVTDKVNELDLDDIYEGALQSCVYEGKYYGLPWLNDVQYMFYNEDMLKQAEIEKAPETWDEMFEDAKVLKEKGICEYPIVCSWAQAECLICAYTDIVGVFGGNFVDEQNNPTLDSEGCQKALQFWVDCVNNGLLNPNSIEMIEDDVLNTFCAGQAAFAINWTYMNSSMNDEAQSSVAGQCKIAPIPGEVEASATVNGGMPLMITKGSAHPDEAWDYMMFLSSKEQQAKYCTNALPIWKSLYEDEDVINTAGADLIEASKVQFQYIVNRPQVPYYSELSTFMQAELQSALLGNETADDAIANMQAKAEELAAK